MVEQCWFTPYTMDEGYVTLSCTGITDSVHGLNGGSGAMCVSVADMFEAQALCDQIPDCDSVWLKRVNGGTDRWACFRRCDGAFTWGAYHDQFGSVAHHDYVASVRKDCATYLGPIPMDTTVSGCKYSSGRASQADAFHHCDEDVNCVGILDWNGDGGVWRHCAAYTASDSSPGALGYVKPPQWCAKGLRNGGHCCHGACDQCGGSGCNNCNGGINNCDDLGLTCCAGMINALPDDKKYCTSSTDEACIVPDADATMFSLRCWKTLTDFGDGFVLSGCAFLDSISGFITTGGDLLPEAVQAACDALADCDAINFRKDGQAILRNCGGVFNTNQYATSTNGLSGPQYDDDE